ncbi:hypothetical protein AZI86_12295 [Bdellovibrio bacteriovorus]|uniref:HEAT repeat domain-containing protein n=1 Tax=Bdellovibrio bacteriovorus TaxID=959 RepID=A0A150WM11_BDEBC|nr:hypothetical protein [Bdellovibrio bacteriovorus]KYG64968.1 hypothetical protein AZI86_12295 [Bdellovibrio bacteriovorus]
MKKILLSMSFILTASLGARGTTLGNGDVGSAEFQKIKKELREKIANYQREDSNFLIDLGKLFQYPTDEADRQLLIGLMSAEDGFVSVTSLINLIKKFQNDAGTFAQVCKVTNKMSTDLRQEVWASLYYYSSQSDGVDLKNKLTHLKGCALNAAMNDSSVSVRTEAVNVAVSLEPHTAGEMSQYMKLMKSTDTAIRLSAARALLSEKKNVQYQKIALNMYKAEKTDQAKFDMLDTLTVMSYDGEDKDGNVKRSLDASVLKEIKKLANSTRDELLKLHYDELLTAKAQK